MSNSISGGISFSGIGSGTDFEAMVEQLKEVESFKLYSLEDSRDVATEKYDAMVELTDTVREAMEALEALNSPSKFLTKVANSSDETVLTAEANADAIDGTYTIDVQQLASAALWGSNTTYESKDTVINTSGATQTLSYTYKGEKHSVEVGAGTTLEGLQNIINKDQENLGVKMQVIKVSGGYTFQIAGQESGKDGTLEIDATNLVGFNGGDTTWRTSASAAELEKAFDADDNVKEFTYTLMLDNGDAADKSIEVGPLLGNNATNEDLKNAINAASQTAVGRNVAEIVDGKLVFDGVKSMVAKSVDEADVEDVGDPTTVDALTTFTMDAAAGMDTKVAAGTYSFRMSDNTLKEVEVTGSDVTMTQFVAMLKTEGITATGTVEGGKATFNVEDAEAMTTSGDATAAVSNVESGYSHSIANVDPNTRLQPETQPSTMEFSVTLSDGTTKNINVVRGDSWDSIFTDLASDASNGVTYDKNTGTLTGITSVDTGANVLYALDGELMGDTNWTITQAQDAKFKMSGISQEITSSTNEVTEVIEGITFTLKGTGETQVTVASDTDSVKANIQLFLDSVNSVIKKMQDLTAVTVDDSDSTYSEDATLNNTTAGPLNGEYGINLFTSRLKSAMTGSPEGFKPMTGADIFSGDFVATLAHMGIKTDADESSSTYGQFVIAPQGSTDAMQAFDQELFDNAIANKLEDVISFFSADNEGSSNSPDFRYDSHVDGITKAGTYDVSYTVAGGTISNVMINGVAADVDPENSNVYVATGAAGDAAGVAIYIDNMVDASYTGSVSIKQGLVGKMEDFFSDELTYFPPSADDPALGSDNGGLMIMQNSYNELMLSLDEQISNELTRLTRWEENERMKFARLDTLLGEYNSKMEMLTSQLGQLG